MQIRKSDSQIHNCNYINQNPYLRNIPINKNYKLNKSKSNEETLDTIGNNYIDKTCITSENQYRPCLYYSKFEVDRDNKNAFSVQYNNI